MSTNMSDMKYRCEYIDHRSYPISDCDDINNLYLLVLYYFKQIWVNCCTRFACNVIGYVFKKILAQCFLLIAFYVSSFSLRKIELPLSSLTIVGMCKANNSHTTKTHLSAPYAQYQMA